MRGEERRGEEREGEGAMIPALTACRLQSRSTWMNRVYRLRRAPCSSGINFLLNHLTPTATTDCAPVPATATATSTLRAKATRTVAMLVAVAVVVAAVEVVVVAMAVVVVVDGSGGGGGGGGGGATAAANVENTVSGGGCNIAEGGSGDETVVEVTVTL